VALLLVILLRRQALVLALLEECLKLYPLVLPNSVLQDNPVF
jgi:hypothetical protein